MKMLLERKDKEMVIQGQVCDIQPNNPKPTLELNFHAKYRNALPQGARTAITLNLNGTQWYGTINSSGSNRPFLHIRLSQNSGKPVKCTQVFLELGLAEKAILDFECEPHATLRLVKIVDHGKWRPGNEPGKRGKRAQAARISWPGLNSNGIEVNEDPATGTSTVVFPSRTSGAKSRRQITQAEFERYLKSVLNDLDSLHRTHPITDMHFPGGGSLVIPEWFREWCDQRGIKIHIDSSKPPMEKSLETDDQCLAGNEPGKRTASAPVTRRRSSNNIRRTGTQDGDIERLAEALRRDFPEAKPSEDRAWSRAPAVRIIDCVLSLNRQYDAFVVRRLNKFEKDHPQITSVRSLRNLIDKSPTPADFLREVLDYNHDDRAGILYAVINYLLEIVKNESVETEISRLELWAQNTHPEEHVQLGIRGFALAGFQYLRMLFGANTTKPDTHICSYVEEAVGHPVSDLGALKLLEAAAKRQSILLRNADTNIWEKRARGGK